MSKRALVGLIASLGCACRAEPTASPPLGAAPVATPYAGLAAAVAPPEAPNTTSVLVLHRGAVVHELYVGGATAETLHDTRSVGKSMTALAVGIALDRGALPGLDAAVWPYFAELSPANPSAAKAAITIEDLLTMSSALDCDDDDPASPGNEEGMYPTPVWTRWIVDLPTRADYARDDRGRGPWRYCTAGTMLLGQLVARVAGQPIDEFMATHLFAPLGIAHWQFARSSAGEAMTGGGLRLRTRDLAALGELIRRRGAVGDRRVVSAAYVARMVTRHRTASAADHVDYGYLLWHRVHPSPCGDQAAWYMSGNGGNLVAIFDELEAVVVVTRINYNQRAMHDQTRGLVERHVLPSLCQAAGAR